MLSCLKGHYPKPVAVTKKIGNFNWTFRFKINVLAHAPRKKKQFVQITGFYERLTELSERLAVCAFK